MPLPHPLGKLAPMLNAFSHTSSISGQHYSTPGWTHLAPDIVEEGYAVDDDGDVDDATSSDGSSVFSIDLDFVMMTRAREFTLQHVQALLPASNALDMLCVSVNPAWADRTANPFASVRHELQVLTAFRNLSKLGLHCDQVSPCLKPLNSLSCLRDLTLIHVQVFYRSPLCLQDFDSNVRARLLHFRWFVGHYGADLSCDDALDAISRVAALQTLSISVPQITRAEALLLGSLSNPWSVQLYIRDAVSGGVLEMLSSGHAHIQLLSLYSLPLSALSSLKPMEDLNCLIIDQVEFYGQSKLMLQPQPHLQHLVLKGIWLSEKQHAQLLCTCPALKVLIFSSKHQLSTVQRIIFDARAGKDRPAGKYRLRWLRRSVIGVSVGFISRWVLATAWC